MHQCINLSTLAPIGSPGFLPDAVLGLAQSDLDDLSFLPDVHGFAGIGYWPVVDEPHDPDIETHGDVYSVDVETKTVIRAKRDKTSEELEPLRETRRAAVMAMRDAKVEAGITFNGVAFQTRKDDYLIIAGAAQLAFMAVVAGAQPGDLYWHGEETPFAWIALDNSIMTMDAPTVVEFGRAVAARRSACIFHARELKDQIDAAADPRTVNIDTGWPV